MKTEVLASIIAALAALVAAGVSYVSSNNISILQSAIAEFEQQNIRQMPFFERQLEHYVEATSIASQIANASPEIDTREVENRFWQLYWGSLGMFEEEKVARAMVRFGEELKKGKTDNLKKLSLNLAHACRDSIQNQWNIEMDEIKLDVWPIRP